MSRPAASPRRAAPVPAPRIAPWACAARIALAVVGGYLATAWSLAWVAPALMLLFGVSPGDALLLTTLPGFLVYAAVILWAFHARPLGRVAAILIGVAAVGYAFAYYLAPLAQGVG